MTGPDIAWCVAGFCWVIFLAMLITEWDCDRKAKQLIREFNEMHGDPS